VTQESNFKFISVEDDEDEIVIQAGAAPQATASEDVVEEGFDNVQEDDLDYDEDFEDEAELDEEDEEDAAERARFEREKARRQARAEANRMVTTEEDLKASVPFSRMQHIIVVVAILLIVVFFLYYHFGSM